MPYVIAGHGTTGLCVVKRVGGFGGVLVSSNHGGCDIGWMQTFSQQSAFTDWQDEAEWMAALYKHLYTCGHVTYCITNAQLNLASHRALVHIGATQIAEFPNLFHGPAMQFVFHVNLRDACGRYCDKYGDAYKEPPKDESEVIVSPTTAQPHGYQYLPTRPKDEHRATPPAV
jgi:hypothetical protein